MSQHCVFSVDSSGFQTQSKSGHTKGRNQVSPRCEFSCASSSLETFQGLSVFLGLLSNSLKVGFILSQLQLLATIGSNMAFT